MRDIIEFYDGNDCIASVESSMVPPIACKISIRQKTWAVVRISYALDHADDRHGKRMRANVDLAEVKR